MVETREVLMKMACGNKTKGRLSFCHLSYQGWGFIIVKEGLQKFRGGPEIRGRCSILMDGCGADLTHRECQLELASQKPIISSNCRMI